MKNKILILALAAVILLLCAYPYFDTVGRMSGIENEKVIIEKGKFAGEYEISSCSHSSSDRGKIIGNLQGSHFDYYAYRTSCGHGCIYVASSGRGEFYEPVK